MRTTKTNLWKFLFLYAISFSPQNVISQSVTIEGGVSTVGFTIPDTICVNTPLNIINTSTAASTYFWNFCVTSFNTTPNATNLGNIGNLFSKPVFIDNLFQNGNYYGFLVNNDPGGLIRLDFGNSLLNTPTATYLGDFGGIIPRTAEGIQVVEANGKWQAIIVGGTPLSGGTPRILKIDFGANLNNPAPTATNWGNIGNIDQPIDLFLFKDVNNLFGFTVNSSNNSITRFNFGTDFINPPTAVNLGGFGSLNYPTGICAISDNGFWRIFITNGGSNKVTRLDFGSSLLNTPVPVDLGGLSNTLSQPRDIYILKYCDDAVGFIVNQSSTLIKLNFNNGLSSIPTATSLGNVGNLSFPHSISQLFRVGADVYCLIPNVDNNTITRLQFPGCSNANISNFSGFTPPPIIYNQPGTYNINLTIDEGLPTQKSLCKSIVVVAPLPKRPLIDSSFCKGDSLVLKVGINTRGIIWNTGSVNDSIIVKSPGIYWVQSNYYGCSKRDSFSISENIKPIIDLGMDTSICIGDSVIFNAGNVGSQYLWQDGSSQQTFTAKVSQIYYVKVINSKGCFNKDSVMLNVNSLPFISLTNDTTICKGKPIQLLASGNNITNYQWIADPSLSNYFISNPIATPSTSTKYFVSFTDNNKCKNKDSVLVNIASLPVINTLPDTATCKGSAIILATSGSANLSYHWSPGNSVSDSTSANPIATPLINTVYSVTVKNTSGCIAQSNVNVVVKPLPVLTVSGDTSICASVSVQLQASAVGGNSFVWFPATYLDNPKIANPIATPVATTFYKVTAKGGNNCSSVDSVLIQIFPAPQFLLSPSKISICKGDSALLTASGGDQYQWMPLENVLQPQSAITKVFPTSDTKYSVTITNNKCNVSKTLETSVTVLPLPIVTVSKSNDINCTLGQATLVATGGTIYNWQPSSLVRTPDASSTTAFPSATTYFYVYVSDNSGCSTKDSIEIIVTKASANNYLLPNAFTPNGDGVNDCFGISLWGQVSELNFSVYDRFGQRVFFTSDPQKCWDGKFKGILQPNGVFVYHIIAKTICGNIDKKGIITLLR